MLRSSFANKLALVLVFAAGFAPAAHAQSIVATFRTPTTSQSVPANAEAGPLADLTQLRPGDNYWFGATNNSGAIFQFCRDRKVDWENPPAKDAPCDWETRRFGEGQRGAAMFEWAASAIGWNRWRLIATDNGPLPTPVVYRLWFLEPGASFRPFPGGGSPVIPTQSISLQTPGGVNWLTDGPAFFFTTTNINTTTFSGEFRQGGLVRRVPLAANATAAPLPSDFQMGAVDFTILTVINGVELRSNTVTFFIGPLFSLNHTLTGTGFPELAQGGVLRYLLSGNLPAGSRTFLEIFRVTSGGLVAEPDREISFGNGETSIPSQFEGFYQVGVRVNLPNGIVVRSITRRFGVFGSGLSSSACLSSLTYRNNRTNADGTRAQFVLSSAGGIIPTAPAGNYTPTLTGPAGREVLGVKAIYPRSTGYASSRGMLDVDLTTKMGGVLLFVDSRGCGEIPQYFPFNIAPSDATVTDEVATTPFTISTFGSTKVGQEALYELRGDDVITEPSAVFYITGNYDVIAVPRGGNLFRLNRPDTGWNQQVAWRALGSWTNNEPSNAGR
jgi:hypothetical protein